jgi:hypothetical protein
MSTEEGGHFSNIGQYNESMELFSMHLERSKFELIEMDALINLITPAIRTLPNTNKSKMGHLRELWCKLFMAGGTNYNGPSSKYDLNVRDVDVVSIRREFQAALDGIDREH